MRDINLEFPQAGRITLVSTLPAIHRTTKATHALMLHVMWIKRVSVALDEFTFWGTGVFQWLYSLRILSSARSASSFIKYQYIKSVPNMATNKSNEDRDVHPHDNPPISYMEIFRCSFPATGGFLFGYDAGYINGCLGSKLFLIFYTSVYTC